jgi:hypothetical protein
MLLGLKIFIRVFSLIYSISTSNYSLVFSEVSRYYPLGRHTALTVILSQLLLAHCSESVQILTALDPSTFPYLRGSEKSIQAAAGTSGRSKTE